MTIEESIVDQIRNSHYLLTGIESFLGFYAGRKALLEHIFLTTTLALCKSQVASSIDGTEEQLYSGKRREES